MLPDTRKTFRMAAILLFIFSCFLTDSAFAQNIINVNPISAQSILINIAKQMPNLMRMVTAIAYVMGMYFVFLAVVKLRSYGESRTMMSQEHSLKGPLIYMAIGAFLIYLPTSVQVGMSTFWTSPNPYGYLQEQDQWSAFIGDLYLIIQFVGVIAFMRGLVIMTHLAGQGGQPGTFARGMTHIIGGIFCINIYQFVQTIWATMFGVN